MATDKKQFVPLPELDHTDRAGRATKGRLMLETGKGYNGGLQCDATVHHVGNGFATHAFGLGSGGDFSEKVALNKTARATQKAIDTLHDQTFTQDAIDGILQRVKQWYAAHPVTL